MDVTWRIEASGVGTRVTIEHAFPRRGSLFGAVVQRQFVRPIATRTLETFRTLAEALADG
jgi:hypothetical protein